MIKQFCGWILDNLIAVFAVTYLLLRGFLLMFYGVPFDAPREMACLVFGIIIGSFKPFAKAIISIQMDMQHMNRNVTELMIELTSEIESRRLQESLDRKLRHERFLKESKNLDK